MFNKDISLDDLDKIIHEPARLLLCGILNSFEEVDFNFLLRSTGMSNGNLVTHLRKMEDAGYISVKKEFKDRKPCTSYSFTWKGREQYLKHKKILKKMIG